MAADETGKSGTSEGTHAAGKILDVDQGRAAKVGIGQAEVEAAMASFLGDLAQPASEQPELALDDDCLFSGPVKHVADKLEGARGRGRPKGSQNKNTWRDTMLRMGYRHPGQNLLDIANANPVALAAEMSINKADALGMIIRANAELLPYFEGKAAQEINHNVRQLGLFIVGDMSTDLKADTGLISLTEVDKPE
jgi:hypothetical protein